MSPSTPTENVLPQSTPDRLALLQEQLDLERRLSLFIQAPSNVRRAQTQQMVLDMVSVPTHPHLLRKLTSHC